MLCSSNGVMIEIFTLFFLAVRYTAFACFTLSLGIALWTMPYHTIPFPSLMLFPLLVLFYANKYRKKILDVGWRSDRIGLDQFRKIERWIFKGLSIIINLSCFVFSFSFSLPLGLLIQLFSLPMSISFFFFFFFVHFEKLSSSFTRPLRESYLHQVRNVSCFDINKIYSTLLSKFSPSTKSGMSSSSSLSPASLSLPPPLPSSFFCMLW